MTGMWEGLHNAEWMLIFKQKSASEWKSFLKCHIRLFLLVPKNHLNSHEWSLSR